MEDKNKSHQYLMTGAPILDLSWLLSIVGGWLWDFTGRPIASFAPVALGVLVIVALASTVKNARQ